MRNNENGGKIYSEMTYLKLWEVFPHKEADEFGYEVGINDLLDGRILLLGEESSETNRAEDDSQIVWIVDKSEELLEVGNL